MKRIFYHPLWTHLPAVVLLAIIGAEFALNRWVFQYSIPVHFTLGGEPDRWGSGWQLVLPTVIFALILIAGSILIDELWARQERRKTFNWMALLDEVTVGMMAGMMIGYFRQAFLGSGAGEERMVGYLHIPVWPWVVGTVLLATILAVILEMMRPHRPVPASVPRVDTNAMEAEIRSQTQAGQRWVYWESQNPRWMSLLIFAYSAMMAVAAIGAWNYSPWLSLSLFVLGLAFFLLYGGLRVSVTSTRLDIRLGILGLRLLGLPIADIDEATVHDFAPLQDFGGYGIRFNREMKAYFFRGNRGVLIRTVSGKQYLIGSDTPEQLASVIQSVQGEKVGTDGRG